MNDPRVAAIWEDGGDLSYHRDFIAGRLADPRTLPLIGTFGGWWEVISHVRFFAFHAALAIVPCAIVVVLARPFGRLLAPR